MFWTELTPTLRLATDEFEDDGYKFLITVLLWPAAFIPPMQMPPTCFELPLLLVLLMAAAPLLLPPLGPLDVIAFFK